MLPDVESPYYWVRHLINMVVWFLCLLGGLFGILWIAQQIGGDILPLGKRLAAHAEDARSAAAAGNHRMAIEHFSAALAIDDSQADLWMGRAVSHLQVKKPQAALDDAAAAVARGMPEPQVMLLRALAFNSLGRPREAVAELDRAVTTDPAAPGPRRARATLYARAGSLDKAMADLDILLAANPADLDAKLLRAEIFVGSGNWPSAATEFLNLAKISTGHPKLWVGAGVALLGAGRDPEALAAFDEALAVRQSGSNIRTAAMLGQAVTLRRLGQLDRAINAWSAYTAVSRSPIGPSVQSVTVDSQFLQRVYFDIASAVADDDGFVPSAAEASPNQRP